MTTELQKILKGKLCPYCKCETELVLGEIIYPHRTEEQPRPTFLDKKYYVCKNDPNHYVGTYSDKVTSLGRLADTELRSLKNEGHRTFDPLWREMKILKSQKVAYKWLAESMDLPIKLTHFGMFTAEQCKEAILICNKLINENK